MQAIKEIQLGSLGRLSSRLQRLVENKLWLKVLIGLALGVVVGVLLGPDLKLVSSSTSALITGWLALPGQLFLALIQMIVIPLILASVIRGFTAASSMTQLKSFGLWGSVFFLVMTVFSSGLGIAVGSLIDPGSYIDSTLIQAAAQASPVVSESSAAVATLPSMVDLPAQVVGILPNNPLASFSSGDMLGTVVFAIVFGIALLSLPSASSAPLYELLGSIQQVCLTIVGWAMRLAPLAVFGLITKLTAHVGMEVLAGMLIYVLSVLCGLLILMCVYGLIIALYSPTSVANFFIQTREALLLAFSTSSSAAVMPLSIKTLEEKLNINSSIVRFIVPLGATINMTGTALYQSVAIIFLASIYGVNLDGSALVLIVTMILFASVGSPATPGASIIILAMMLDQIGIPQSGLALLLGVDRILDMCRTVVNVMGDMVACLVLQKGLGH
jgi:Na+/H+-dicarboxylate symporter